MKWMVISLVAVAVGSGLAAGTASGFARIPYHGPADLGVFHMNSAGSATPLKYIQAAIGNSRAPGTNYICYRDPSSGAFMWLARGADDPNLVRGISLSTFRNCLRQAIYPAANFGIWRTHDGIGLGTAESRVLQVYGKPTTVESAATNPLIYFPGFEQVLNAAALLKWLPIGERVIVYSSSPESADLRMSQFGIANGKVAWILLSDNE